jgi:hypothetical protein
LQCHPETSVLTPTRGRAPTAASFGVCLCELPLKPTKHRWAILAASALLGCGHSDTFSDPTSAVGAYSAGPDIRLTLNPNQDYWPTWTEDGQGILYSYVDQVPGSQHRCIGLLPVVGGTRIWQLCDNRATQADSTNSFPAYSLGADGRLIYAEATTHAGLAATSPDETTLWLADSAAPFQRRALLTLPTFAGSTPVAWLADISWTGPTTFIALAQDLSLLGHCMFCGPIDSIFYGEAVVRGTITATGATLSVVTGTAGATGYSFAENGASIVYTLRDDRQLYKVPATGGTATVVGVVTPTGGAQLLGVSCRASTCIVADDVLTLTGISLSGAITFPSIVPNGVNELRTVSLTSGVSQVLRTNTTLFATPQISPVTGDVVAQTGGAFGHLQTFTSSGSDLHLYQGLVP